MKNLFYNVEKRVDTLNDLDRIKGSPGKRVFVSENNKFYYWRDEDWYLENSESDYTSYNCQLFQTNTNNPYDNVLGTHSFSDYITWERLDVGLYRGTLEGGFPAYKTQFIHSGLEFNFSIAGSPPSSPPTEILNSFKYIYIHRVDDDTIFVNIYKGDLSATDGLDYYDLEIRVYSENVLRD